MSTAFSDIYGMRFEHLPLGRIIYAMTSVKVFRKTDNSFIMIIINSQFCENRYKSMVIF